MWWGSKRSFLGAHVVITGGSTGIGFALAQQFVSRGANVTLIARTKKRLDSAIAELKDFAKSNSTDSTIRGFPADATDPSQVGCMPDWSREHDDHLHDIAHIWARCR